MSNNLMSYTQFMDLPQNIKWFQQMHKLDSYIKDRQGNIVADFIFDPTFQEDEFKNFMLKEVGLDFSGNVIPRSNKTSKSADLLEEVRDVFQTPSISRFMEETFCLEIEMFGYENPYVN